jgi:D-amino peptidase
MRVVIEQDMEGVAGVLDWAGALKQQGRLAEATACMTDEVNAAVEGALQAGADEVTALEAHPFDYGRLHPRAQVHQGSLLDADVKADALFFVGRHAMSGVADGVLNHTGSSRSIRRVTVNGRAFGELALVAAWFGGRGTPTALVTGDDAACREATDFFGVVETVSVKRGFGCHQAVSLSHDEACRRIREAAARALTRLREFRPFVVRGPVVFDVEYRHSEVVDWICRVPGLTRLDACTTRVEAASFEDALRMYYAQGAMLWRFDAY